MCILFNWQSKPNKITKVLHTPSQLLTCRIPLSLVVYILFSYINHFSKLLKKVNNPIHSDDENQSDNFIVRVQAYFTFITIRDLGSNSIFLRVKLIYKQFYYLINQGKGTLQNCLGTVKFTNVLYPWYLTYRHLWLENVYFTKAIYNKW